MTVRTKVKVYAAKAQEVAESGCTIVEVRGMEIGIFHVSGSYYAWRNVCPHAAAPVCRGKISGTKLPSDVYEYKFGKDNEILRCPWHGWEFDLLTGKHLADESVKLRGYDVIEEGGDLYLLMAR